MREKASAIRQVHSAALGVACDRDLAFTTHKLGVRPL